MKVFQQQILEKDWTKRWCQESFILFISSFGRNTFDKPNGLGIMIYPNGSKYLGEWKNGGMDGKGTLTFPSGYKYVGKYKDGKKWNVTKYDKKGKFVGDWKDGEHLNGALYDKFGKFIGKYVNGELH